jgi:hypothetical protein
MNTFIDKSLTALFRLAHRITSPGSYKKSELNNDAKPKVIRFSPNDIL